MKFLEILLSFLTHQGKSFMQTSSEAVTARVANNARRIAILLAVTAIGITLFCTGFSMAFAAAVNVLDQHMGWTFTTPFLAGLLLAAGALCGLAYSLGEKRWLNAVAAGPEATPPPPAPAGPSIESALAVLIIEVINEFKERRKNAPASPPASPGEAPPV